jgi:pimeloyl-ACP methyl ester carboxylesterase
LLARLAESFKVLAVHHRPLWPNPAPPESLQDWHIFSHDLIRFMDEQELRGVIGIGHSMGAVATMYAAIQRPELFQALVLVEPILLLPAMLQLLQVEPEAMEEVPIVSAARKRRTHWPSAAVAFEHFRPKPVFARFSDVALRDYLAAGLRPAAEGGVTLAFSREWEAAIYCHPPADVWQIVPQISQPTLAVRAAESNSLFPEAWELWQNSQQDAVFVEIMDTGHLLLMERPVELAEVVLRFLADVQNEGA